MSHRGIRTGHPDTQLKQHVRVLSPSISREVNRLRPCKVEGCENMQRTGTGVCVPCKRDFEFRFDQARRKARGYKPEPAGCATTDELLKKYKTLL